MSILNNKFEKYIPEIRDIAVEWKTGVVKGFKSKEDAERYINQICKKAAPDMDYSIISGIIRRL